MDDLFHVLVGLLAILSTWLLWLARNHADRVRKMEERIHELTIKCAVLDSRTDNLDETLSNLSRKLDDVNDKLGEVLSFKPLLEDALGSIRDLRRSRP